MKVYLCGGINGLSDSQCKDWREYAKENLICETIDPMRRDYRGIEDQNVNGIVSGDILDIEDSNVVLVNADKPSWGTAMEIVYAYKMRKRIIAFSNAEKISPWLRYHCQSILPTITQAVASINRWISST